MKRVNKLLRMFGSNAGNPAILDAAVYRTSTNSEITDVWEQKVISMCDGRSVRDLMASLYRQELRKHGWVSDIGLWKGLFERQVISTITRLEQQQAIRIQEDKPIASGDRKE